VGGGLKSRSPISISGPQPVARGFRGEFPARIWADRLAALSDVQLDRSPGQGWSFRLLAAHVAGSLDYYAGAVGRLGAAANLEEQV
jgi:hypothetical protein